MKVRYFVYGTGRGGDETNLDYRIKQISREISGSAPSVLEVCKALKDSEGPLSPHGEIVCESIDGTPFLVGVYPGYEKDVGLVQSNRPMICCVGVPVADVFAGNAHAGYSDALAEWPALRQELFAAPQEQNFPPCRLELGRLRVTDSADVGRPVRSARFQNLLGEVSADAVPELARLFWACSRRKPCNVFTAETRKTRTWCELIALVIEVQNRRERFGFCPVPRALATAKVGSRLVFGLSRPQRLSRKAGMTIAKLEQALRNDRSAFEGVLDALDIRRPNGPRARRVQRGEVIRVGGLALLGGSLAFLATFGLLSLIVLLLE